MTRPKPIFLMTTLEDAEEADLTWWLAVSPEIRVSGVDSAREDWLAISGGAALQSYSDFEDLFRHLNAHRAKYLVIGGYAVAHHVGPRYTKDIDIWIERSSANAEKVLEALGEFIGDLGIAIERLTRPETLLILGVPPNRVDVLTHLEGMEFEQAWQRRSPGRYRHEDVGYLGLDDLMLSKRLAGRPQDLIDLQRLERLKRRLSPDG